MSTYTLTAEDVLKIAAELIDLDDDTWPIVLDLAQQIVSNVDDAWGGPTKAKHAATYLAAHLAKLALVAANAKGASLPAGPVTGVTVGPVSRQSAALSSVLTNRTALDGTLTLTPYGLTFLSLRRVFSYGRFVVT